jgi:hypothetical protein
MYCAPTLIIAIGGSVGSPARTAAERRGGRAGRVGNDELLQPNDHEMAKIMVTSRTDWR